MNFYTAKQGVRLSLGFAFGHMGKVLYDLTNCVHLVELLV